MKVEYTNRAVADLRKISADSRRAFGDRVAEELEVRIQSVIDRISRDPLSTPEVEGRPGVHAVLLIRYPFKIFLPRARRSRADPAHQAHRTATMVRWGLTHAVATRR
jgi:plasmid stabilization system protein ParE